MLQAQEHGVPEWLQLLAARLYTGTGQLEMGLSILENYRKTVTEEKALESIDNRIADIKARLAKSTK